jgi:hypothetical protein
MSAYKKIITEYRSMESLVAAIKEIGYDPDISANPHENTISLIGYHGDVRPEQAAIRIPRKQLSEFSNDVGFLWNGESYDAIISDFDGSEIFTQDIQNHLKQRYAVNEAKHLAELNGYSVEEISNDDGTVQLVCVGESY